MKSKAPLAIAAVIGIVLIVAVRALMGLAGSPDRPASGPGGDEFTPRAGCTLVVVAASSEKAGILHEIAADYSADSDVEGTCVDVKVNTMASGSAEAALAAGWDEKVHGDQPTVWSPAASTWVGLLRGDLASNDRPNIVPDEVNSIASTPLVLAMPKPMAEALGWPKKQIGWADVTKLANDPAGWASVGHPEWGKFTLGKTNPNLSTSGLAATVGTFVAATGRSSDLSTSDLEDPKVRRFAQNVEKSVLHYGDTTLTYLSNLQRADDAGSGLGYVSAVAVEEKSVLDYNAGNPTGDPATAGDHPEPRTKLAAVYPKEGTLYSDNPYVVLDAAWVSEEQKAAARDFESYLRSDAAQKQFTDAGFRTYDGTPGDPIRNSAEVLADGVKVTLSPPNPAVLDGVRSTWSELRKKARVLIVLDVSGSMGDLVGSSGRTKLDLAKTAAVGALDQFSPHDEVGVWSFTTDLPEIGNSAGIYSELVAVEKIGTNRSRIETSVGNLTPLRGTPLYAATRAAAAKMAAEADPEKINAVVVLTDGQNEYPGDSNLDSLLSELGGGSAESKLRVFSIAYGEGADLDTLRAISEASGAAAYDATNPASIDAVFTAVLSNF